MVCSFVASTCCCRPAHREHNTVIYQRGIQHNIALTIDTIMGAFLAYQSQQSDSKIMAAASGFQLWPLAAFLTLAVLECVQGVKRSDRLMVEFVPCSCRRRANLDPDSDNL